MEQMLQSAGALLIEALPTFVIVVILHWYLKTTLFQPLEKVLADRHAQTEGARQQAAAALTAAQAKVEEYENRLRAARSEIYQEQEAWRRQLLDEQSRAVAQARQESQTQVSQAKAQIDAQIAAGRAALSQEAEGLANLIVASILKGSKN
jgi:F-type H+-transporting ATPase subunit b